MSDADNAAGPGARLSILGAGVAGLAAGHYAKNKGIPFTIYESSARIGGLCATLRHGDFLFDCGAHRFHDKDPEVTREVKALLGNRLQKIYVPSHIYHHGAMVNFPFTPLNIVKSIGLAATARAGLEALRSRSAAVASDSDFESFAIATYGKTLARLFLLNYSEKLWGMSSGRLSTEIAGERLKGFTPKALILEILSGRKRGASHVDGAFYYPRGGIGDIADSLAASCGWDTIRTNAAITRVTHDTKKITALEINGQEQIAVGNVISTLPCTALAGMLDPAPPDEILQSAAQIHFRDIILAALFLNRESVTKSATVYFPASDFCFTRVYEPKNRSANMAPQGMTSLVAEIPCRRNGRLWQMQDAQLVDLVSSQLRKCGWVRHGDMLDSRVVRVPCAYPIIEKQSKDHVEKIQAHLNGFANLKTAGRNGMFKYSWIHNMIHDAKRLV